MPSLEFLGSPVTEGASRSEALSRAIIKLGGNWALGGAVEDNSFSGRHIKSDNVNYDLIHASILKAAERGECWLLEPGIVGHEPNASRTPEVVASIPKQRKAAAAQLSLTA